MKLNKSLVGKKILVKNMQGVYGGYATSDAELPGWTEEMDYTIGRVYTVSQVDLFIRVEGSRFTYHPDWVTVIDDEELLNAIGYIEGLE